MLPSNYFSTFGWWVYRLSITLIEDYRFFDLLGCCATFLAHYNNNLTYSITVDYKPA